MPSGRAAGGDLPCSVLPTATMARPRPRQPGQHPSNLPSHGRRLDVAVPAGLVAVQPDVELQDGGWAAHQRAATGGLQQSAAGCGAEVGRWAAVAAVVQLPKTR